MPSCIVAFHVTCAFDHGLEMKTLLAENDEVRFKSFCLEHSSASSGGTNINNAVNNGSHAVTTGANGATELNVSKDLEQRPVSHSVSASERAERDQLEREKATQRKQKLQELEDEFYRLVNPGDVAENLGLPLIQVDLVIVTVK